MSKQKSVGWDPCGREARFGLLKNLSMMREKVRYILLRNEIYLRSVTCGFPTSTLLSKVFIELQLFYYYSYLNTLSLLQATLTILFSQFGKGNIFLTSKSNTIVRVTGFYKSQLKHAYFIDSAYH